MSSVRVSLGYGRGTKSLELPEENLIFLNPDFRDRNMEPAVALEKALRKPIGDVNLEDFVEGRRICVSIEDSTRKEPHREMIDAVSRRLSAAKEVLYIIATGTHDPKEKGNVEIRNVVQEIASRYSLNFNVTANDSKNRDDFKYVGMTSRGTRVFANKAALDMDAFVIVSDMKPHYFAGYSNAIKHFLPGICSYETIEENHCRLIIYENSHYGFHPWHYDSARRDNPIAVDMLEAMELIADGRETFVLATITDEGVLWSGAGDVERVTREGIRKVDELLSFSVKPAKYIVASPGGWPFDRYFYTAQRALELIRDVIREDGEVLLVGECSDGIHSKTGEAEEFYSALKKDSSWLRENLERDNLQFYFYKAYRFKRSLERVRKIYVHSSLGRGLRDIGLIPSDDPQDVIDTWLMEDPGADILVINKANKLAVYKGR